MKLWQKVYLTTMILFVMLLNIGIYVVFELTYQKDIATEQTQAEAQYNILTSNLTRSIDSMYKQGDVTDAKLQKVIENYENYYDDTLDLTLWRGEISVYPKDEEVLRDWNPIAGKNELIIEGKDNKIITIQGTLYEGDEILFLRCEKKLTKLAQVWDKLQAKYLVISLSFSFVLAVFLFILLKKTMKPIEELTQVVDNMAEGNLESRALEHGKDEIATLGRHFNQMADKIQENILLIQSEAAVKQEFVDNFAHELKSPLTSIYGFAEYIQKANVSEDEKIQCMSYIMEESKLLLQLSYSLLDMAKIRNEEIDIEEISLDDIEEQIKKRMETLCQQRKVTLTCNRSVQNMYAKEDLLYSLLCNLIQNAIYSCENGGAVSWGVDDKDDKIRIFVEDNGCGMTKEQVKRVTEPFFRVDKSRRREEGRTGLGLAICNQIVEYHNGQMDIKSEINKGTIVTVFIPKKFTV
ncbi:MAG: HAMP domain-containing histidine kinase [Lachnospiraceae bacterium]|nr:HAMP domain-containing histidine kinase [Lachnospiraceae bacterium]